MRGLYAIVDVDTLEARELDVVRFADAVLAAKPAAIQLRDKSGGARRTLALLRAIRPLAARVGVPFFANDRADLARLAETTGVHVGQDDLPVALARQVAPGLRVGLSTHDEAQLTAAIAEAPDYVAIGPIFQTASKERPSPVVGLVELARLARLARRLREPSRAKIPLVAIGGIGADTAAEVAMHADAIAVIGGLVGKPGEAVDPYEAAFARATALQAIITSTKRAAA